jgi:hypothetical protein
MNSSGGDLHCLITFLPPVICGTNLVKVNPAQYK